jgi:hypothetical protein
MSLKSTQIDPSRIGWVICHTHPDNWDDESMDFTDTSALTFDLYSREQIDEHGLRADAEPVATIDDNEAFDALLTAYVISWGDVYQDGDDQISQGGRVHLRSAS